MPKNCYGAARRRKKFHYWLQGRIQKYTRYKAQANGIRFSRVLASGTSQYAFDGSGQVHRVGNRQTAIFAGGNKVYNCDLSASYNIGARYWIREFLVTQKPARNKQVATQDESFSAAAAGHQQTLASLIALRGLSPPGDATAPVLYSGQGFSPARETATIAAAWWSEDVIMCRYTGRPLKAGGDVNFVTFSPE